MFFIILITDNIMTRTIGYYLLLVKIVVQIVVFPILLLRLDQAKISKFVCTKVFPAFMKLDFLTHDKHVSENFINAGKNFSEKDVLAPAL